MKIWKYVKIRSKDWFFENLENLNEKGKSIKDLEKKYNMKNYCEDIKINEYNYSKFSRKIHVKDSGRRNITYFSSHKSYDDSIKL